MIQNAHNILRYYSPILKLYLEKCYKHNEPLFFWGIDLVSWGFAFRKGLVIWLWTILWGILGGIIAIVVSGGALVAALIAGTAEAFFGAFLAIMAGSIFGMLVVSIGTYASIVKIVTESTLKEQEKLETRMCPQCGRTVALDLKFCPHCGKSFV